MATKTANVLARVEPGVKEEAESDAMMGKGASDGRGALERPRHS